jgi:hypothetical protein
MEIRTESSGPFSDLMSSRVSTPELAHPFVPNQRDRTSLLKRFDPVRLDINSAAEVNGNETVAAQTDEGWSESPKTGREIIRGSLAGLVVMSAGCVFTWCMVHLIQSLLEAELFVLRSTLPFHP